MQTKAFLSKPLKLNFKSKGQQVVAVVDDTSPVSHSHFYQPKDD